MTEVTDRSVHDMVEKENGRKFRFWPLPRDPAECWRCQIHFGMCETHIKQWNRRQK